MVVALVQPPGPLDDPDPAFQRDGLLLDGPVVQEEVIGVGFGARPVVLLFVREPPDPAALAVWAEGLPPADVYVVLPAPTLLELPLEEVVDPLGRLSGAVGMPVPRDGGRPVGYALVDSDRVVRYATIDPSYLKNAFEVATVLRAVS